MTGKPIFTNRETLCEAVAEIFVKYSIQSHCDFDSLRRQIVPLLSDKAKIHHPDQAAFDQILADLNFTNNENFTQAQVVDFMIKVREIDPHWDFFLHVKRIIMRICEGARLTRISEDEDTMTFLSPKQDKTWKFIFKFDLENCSIALYSFYEEPIQLDEQNQENIWHELAGFNMKELEFGSVDYDFNSGILKLRNTIYAARFQQKNISYQLSTFLQEHLQHYPKCYETLESQIFIHTF